MKTSHWLFKEIRGWVSRLHLLATLSIIALPHLALAQQDLVSTFGAPVALRYAPQPPVCGCSFTLNTVTPAPPVSCPVNGSCQEHPNCDCTYIEVTNTDTDTNCSPIVQLDISGPTGVCFTACGWVKDGTLDPSLWPKWDNTAHAYPDGCVVQPNDDITMTKGSNSPIYPAPRNPSKYIIQLCTSVHPSTFTVTAKLANGSTCTQNITI